MDIIPMILSEKEFREFNLEDYRALEGVLNDTLAKHIKNYINNPEADRNIVDNIKDLIGNTIESYTIHDVIKERGITELLVSLSPENLLNGNLDYDKVYEQLAFLQDNFHKLRSSIPGRSKDSYTTFYSSIKGVVSRMRMNGQSTTYPDLLELIECNKFIFYVPNDKGHSTGINIVFSKRNQWIMCIKGIEYKRYCDNNDIEYHKRRMF